jgi:hypothetical protein
MQCAELVASLQRTQMWFCCAHGRPTTVPLVDLATLERALQLRGAEGGRGRARGQTTGIRARLHIALASA